MRGKLSLRGQGKNYPYTSPKAVAIIAVRRNQTLSVTVTVTYIAAEPTRADPRFTVRETAS